jgi:ABC-type nitrate/sulfonate/bicarbonate transport system permease component
MSTLSGAPAGGVAALPAAARTRSPSAPGPGAAPAATVVLGLTADQVVRIFERVLLTWRPAYTGA